MTADSAKAPSEPLSERAARIITEAFALVATADEMPEEEPESLREPLRRLRLAINDSPIARERLAGAPLSSDNERETGPVCLMCGGTGQLEYGGAVVSCGTCGGSGFAFPQPANHRQGSADPRRQEASDTLREAALGMLVHHRLKTGAKHDAHCIAATTLRNALAATSEPTTGVDPEVLARALIASGVAMNGDGSEWGPGVVRIASEHIIAEYNRLIKDTTEPVSEEAPE